MSYESKANSFSNVKKTVLAHIFPTQRIILWSLDSGAVYKTKVDHFVESVLVDSTELSEGVSTSLNSGEFYFDFDSKYIYVRMTDDSNPQSNYVSVKYKIFFSNVAINLPHDLSSGKEVCYQPLIYKISDFPVGIDNQNQFGIALESSGSISFFVDDFFIENFDKLFWENKEITIYSYLPDNLDDKKIIFNGEVTDKSFSTTNIRFSIKDFVHKLKQPIQTDLFSASDGSINDSIIGKAKRIIYGRLEGLQIQSLDQVVSGIDMTGSLSTSAASKTITGNGTSFLDELSPDDEITFSFEGEYYTFLIEDISSNTSATFSEECEFTSSGRVATIKPAVPYRKKNRTFLISGHKLRQPSTTITSVSQLNRFRVASIADFFAGDTIKINDSINRKIKRITNDEIVLTQNLNILPSVGQTVVKNPVYNVYFNQKKMVIDRDWTINNTNSFCKISLTDTAEINSTNVKRLTGNVTLTNGSRDVSATGSNFKNDLNVRDWIRSDDVNHTTWYEILKVTDDTNLVLRTPYTGSNITTSYSEKKNVTYIEDDSIVTVDCLGKENSSGDWVKTASDVVYDLLLDAGIDSSEIDASSFTEAKEEMPYIMSIKIPESFNGSVKKTRDIITNINKSVFGSLITKNNYKIAYNVLSASRPTASEGAIKDDNLVSYTFQTKTEIYKKIIAKYKHQDADRYSHEAASSVVEFESIFVKNLIGSNDTKEVTLFLFDANDAQTMAERYSFHHSLTQSVIDIRGGGLSFADKEINDKLYLDLKGLYNRFGVNDNQSKIVMISSLKRDGLKVDISATDLGNLFNRSGAITENSANSFEDASLSEKILNGYIVDNDTELPSTAPTSADEWGTNLIS